MTADWQTGHTSVAHLRIKSSGLDAQTARLRAATVMRTLSLQPACLPPEAILCIRALRDPQPGGLRLGATDLRAAPAWEGAVREAIERLARQASRPAEGVVPANAEAVVFRDRAELLACLARDWCAGEVTAHWWWRSLLGQHTAAPAVVKAWSQSPEYIPAGLQLLALQRQVVPFMRKLSDLQVQALTLAVTRAFGLAELHAVLEARAPLPTPAPLQEAETPPAGGIDRQALSPPWPARWMEADAALSPDRELLIGVSLMLERDPQGVRSAQFAQQVQVWRAAAHRAEREPRLPSSGKPLGREGEPPVEKPAIPQAYAPAEVEPGPQPLSISSGPPGTLPAAAAPAGAELLSTQPFPPAGEPAEAVPPASASPALIGQVEIFTEFGACLYLVNLGLYLGFYGDFTTPLAPGIDLPIWDFVALLAVELAGAEVTIDPLWPLLAALAGRGEEEPPGEGFQPPGQASRQAWLEELAHTVRPRLRLALGAEDEDLPRFFRARARLVVTAARLEAFFTLAELPIEIRFAGLDRDPGWVPAAGKWIAFHFD